MDDTSLELTMAQVIGKEADLLIHALEGAVLAWEAVSAAEVTFDTRQAQDAFYLLPSIIVEALDCLIDVTLTDDTNEAMKWAQWRILVRNHRDKWMSRLDRVRLIK